MHIGHLRSTVIGDALVNLYKYQGHEVLGVNHLGDFGTQFGMLLALFDQKYPAFLENPKSIGKENEFLNKVECYYKEAKELFEKDRGFRDVAHRFTYFVQEGTDQKIFKCWQDICEMSLKEFQKIY